MTKEIEQNTQVDSSDWSHAFTKEQVAAWKKEFGDIIHSVNIGDNEYVVRGLGRKEFQTLSDVEFRNDEHMEDTFVKAALLFPQMTEMDLRSEVGGLSNSLFETIMANSNMEAWKDKTDLRLPKDLQELPGELHERLVKTMSSGELSEKDINAWFTKEGSNLYITEFESKIFIYKGLRRSDYEKYREEQRKGKYQGPDAEEEICRRGIIYPFKMEPSSDSYLHGTISSLALMVMKVSGFGATKEVVKL